MSINYRKRVEFFVRFFILGIIIFSGFIFTFNLIFIKPVNGNTLDRDNRNNSVSDLENTNLRGANLKGANLFEVNFKEKDLKQANFKGANLFKANLDKTQSSETNFEGALLIGANLKLANLTLANLSESDLLEANLIKANLSKANLLRANLTRANLEGANLKGANLESANLLGVNLKGANLEGTNLTNTRMKSVDLRGANFKSVNLSKIRSEVALFDQKTIFPKNFNPLAKRMIDSQTIRPTDPLEIMPLWWAFITDNFGNTKNLRMRLTVKEGFLQIFLADYGKTPILLKNTEYNGRKLIFFLPSPKSLKCQLNSQINPQPSRELYPRYFQRNYLIYVGECFNDRKEISNITMASSTRLRPLRGRNLAPSESDIKILSRSLEILDNSSVWNQTDDRVCDDDRKNISWSMFCALYDASLDVTSKYLHSRPAMREVRDVIEEVTNNRPFEHRIRDYNNSTETTFNQVRQVLKIAKKRLQAKVDL